MRYYKTTENHRLSALLNSPSSTDLNRFFISTRTLLSISKMDNKWAEEKGTAADHEEDLSKSHSIIDKVRACLPTLTISHVLTDS